ncbi:MAG: glycosyltransferase [Rhodobacteraceae bacterium]|nr:glycosyltransferase [Paracoccaceae bacterium]
MRFLFYTQSLVSDWNHGNAHFLRGVMRDLIARGHRATALEPQGGWSRANLEADQGQAALDRFATDFPGLTSRQYGPGFDHTGAVEAADVVIVHEWTDPALVAEIGALRRAGGRFTLLFHDTHHRAVSDNAATAGLTLADYDGVLAFGATLRRRYAKHWGARAFTWHEAADIRLFRPHPEIDRSRDLVWIGNWGDGERSREIETFLIEPARRLRLSGSVRGVRYPAEALAALGRSGLDYGGWIANADAPRAFAAHRVTVHIPRRPYVESLPGIPTIRMFEALAAGIPLVSAPWDDCEGLFRPGEDFLFAADGAQMQDALARLLADPGHAAALAASGRQTVLARHTCAHRVDELFTILDRLGAAPAQNAVQKPATEAAL